MSNSNHRHHVHSLHLPWPPASGSMSPCLCSLYTRCCLDVPTQQPQDSLLLLRPRASAANVQLPLFVSIPVMLQGKFFLLRQAQQVASVYPQVTPLRGKQTPKLLPPIPAHSSLPSQPPKAAREPPHSPKYPLPLGERQGSGSWRRKTEMRTKRTGAPQLWGLGAKCLPGRS